MSELRCPDGQTPACTREGSLCTFPACASAYKQRRFKRLNEDAARDAEDDE